MYVHYILCCTYKNIYIFNELFILIKICKLGISKSLFKICFVSSHSKDNKVSFVWRQNFHLIEDILAAQGWRFVNKIFWHLSGNNEVVSKLLSIFCQLNSFLHSRWSLITQFLSIEFYGLIWQRKGCEFTLMHHIELFLSRFCSVTLLILTLKLWSN